MSATSSTRRVYLLDTSVLLRLFRPEDPFQAAAEALFAQHQAGAVGFILLDLSIYELVNAEVRGMGLPSSDVGEDVKALLDLEMHLVRVDAALAIEAAKVAHETGLSGYDGAFVAAGAQMQAPVVTTDEGIIERAAGYDVIHLAELAS